MESHATVPDRTRLYVVTFVVLGILTGIEFMIGGIPFIPALAAGLPDPYKVPALAFFALCKALLVVGVYMHLRFDSRAFRNVLLAGVLGAMLLIGAFSVVMNIDWATK